MNIFAPFIARPIATKLINEAARDAQAAIVAACPDLRTSLTNNPTYRKANPADAPVLGLALTSKTLSQGQLYQVASNLPPQRSQIEGVGHRCRSRSEKLI
jgi:multidrug efflux pump